MPNRTDALGKKTLDIHILRYAYIKKYIHHFKKLGIIHLKVVTDKSINDSVKYKTLIHF